MTLKNKISIISHIINSKNVSKNPELLQAYKEFKELFSHPLLSGSIIETIDRLKNNLVYKEFKLENDPEFFKEILKKIDVSEHFNELLEITSKIKCSSSEQEILNQQLPKFQLFFEFTQVLKKQTGPFYELYGNDLYQLYGIVCSEKTQSKDIEWFLQSPFLKLIHESSVLYKKSLNKIFILLKSTCSSLTKEQFVSLRMKIQKNRNQKTPVNHNMFFCNVPFIGKSLSPVAKKALNNSFREYMTPTAN